jgi:Ca2+-binding RTX toxin-like protein
LDERWSNKEWGNLGIAYDSIIENCLGGSGNDLITRNSANNKLCGQKGNDRLYGGDGNDLLVGGIGEDQAWGQGGQDTFRIQRGTGFTIIKDFRNGEDKIHLGSGVTGLRMVDRNGDAFIDQGSDLLAHAKNAAGDLQLSGSYLI